MWIFKLKIVCNLLNSLESWTSKQNQGILGKLNWWFYYRQHEQANFVFDLLRKWAPTNTDHYAELLF